MGYATQGYVGVLLDPGNEQNESQLQLSGDLKVGATVR